MRITKNKYNEIFKMLKNKANFWIENGEVNAIIGAYTLKFECQNDVLGDQLAENLIA
jgi:hypothetical protein